MTQLKASEEVQAWLMALEAERYDDTWRKRPATAHVCPIPAPVEPAPSAHTQRLRDTAMYQAGRYAEGARDEEAIRGHLRVAKLLNKKGTK